MISYAECSLANTVYLCVYVANRLLPKECCESHGGNRDLLRNAEEYVKNCQIYNYVISLHVKCFCSKNVVQLKS